MEDYNWDLEEHLTYCRIWGCAERRANLLRPHKDIWPKDLSVISRCCDSLFEVGDEQTRPLFLSCCAASALLSGEPYRGKAFEWLESKTMPPGIGLPFNAWPDLSSWRWLRVHLPLISPYTGQGTIMDVILGMGKGEVMPPGPVWAEEVLDATAREALALTAERLRLEQAGVSLFFWPITDPSEKAFITGRSLALPVYLGWKTLCAGLPAPLLAATGTITKEGYLNLVEGVTEKAVAASMHGLKGFIYPKNCVVDSGASLSIDLLPVEDLSEAVAFWRFYTPGAGAAIIHAMNRSDHLSSPLVYLPDIPYGLLTWLQRERSRVGHIIEEGLRDENTTELFVTRLEQLLVKPLCPLDSIGFLLSSISPEMNWNMSKRRPDLAFRVCEAGVICFNHLGNLPEAAKWSEMANSLIPLIEPIEGSESKIFLLQNLSIVQAHNRFEFDPHVEQKLSKELQECLRYMEELLQYHRRKTPNYVSRDLGAFYGTIAQNYGFCGPAYLSSFEEALRKAMDAFGGGKVSGTARENWQREHSYRVYACLDAGRFDEAEAALAAYLDIVDIAQYQTDNNPFRHAALMRFLAGTGRSFPEYVRWASQKAPSVPGRHPWQLWLYNLGRMNEAEKKLRRTAWTKAASICLNQEGETINVMALLPLSALYANGLAKADYLEPRVKRILETIEAGALNSRHFSSLLRARNWQDLLDLTAQNAPSLFPFSYR